MYSLIASYHLENFETTSEFFYFNCMTTFCKIMYGFLSLRFGSLLVDDTSLRNMTFSLKNITTLIHPKISTKLPLLCYNNFSPVECLLNQAKVLDNC